MVVTPEQLAKWRALEQAAEKRDLIAEALSYFYGDQCLDFDADCLCCRAWAELTASRTALPALLDEVERLRAEAVNVRNLSDYPHVQASFINAIRDEGTKNEACDWLQKQWNECCALRATIASLEEENRWLGELLAIIHRDGGHHQVKVGTDQAVKDAHRIWADLQSQRDAQLSSQRKELREAAEIYDEQLDKIESQEARIKELENENHAISEGVSASIARIKALEEGLMDTSRFIDDLADADLDDIVADVGLTVGLAFQMEAKTVYGPRARSLLPPAQGETRGRQDGL